MADVAWMGVPLDSSGKLTVKGSSITRIGPIWKEHPDVLLVRAWDWTMISTW